MADVPGLLTKLVECVVTEPQRLVFEPFAPPKRAPKPLHDALGAAVW